MKKIVSVIFIFALIFTMVCFVSCKKEEEGPKCGMCGKDRGDYGNYRVGIKAVCEDCYYANQTCSLCKAKGTNYTGLCETCLKNWKCNECGTTENRYKLDYCKKCWDNLVKCRDCGKSGAEYSGYQYCEECYNWRYKCRKCGTMYENYKEGLGESCFKK